MKLEVQKYQKHEILNLAPKNRRLLKFVYEISNYVTLNFLRVNELGYKLALDWFIIINFQF